MLLLEKEKLNKICIESRKKTCSQYQQETFLVFIETTKNENKFKKSLFIHSYEKYV